MCQAGQWKANEWPKFPLRISPIWKAMVAAAPPAAAAPPQPVERLSDEECDRISEQTMDRVAAMVGLEPEAMAVLRELVKLVDGNEALLSAVANDGSYVGWTRAMNTLLKRIRRIALVDAQPSGETE